MGISEGGLGWEVGGRGIEERWGQFNNEVGFGWVCFGEMSREQGFWGSLVLAGRLTWGVLGLSNWSDNLVKISPLSGGSVCAGVVPGAGRCKTSK